MKRNTELQAENYIVSEVDKMYKSLLGLCLSINVVFFILYSYFQIWPIVVLDFCGIILFIFLRRLPFHSHKKLIIPMMHLEIILHALLGTILLGWGYDFELIILVLISTVYISSNDYFHNFAYLIILGILIFFLSRILSFAINPLMTPEPLLSFMSNKTIITNVISTVNILVSIGGMIGVASINIRTNKLSINFLNEKNKVLNTLANIDPLTELLNRRFVYEYIERMETKPAKEKKYSNFAIILGDIDDFKDVNDTCGHGTGDLVLKKVAEIMRLSLREIDLICRWGGEEFLIIMPETSLEEAYKVMDDIRLYISQKAFHYNKYRFIVTMTFGIANADLDTKFSEAIAIADEKLYRGKNNGKNQVVIH